MHFGSPLYSPFCSQWGLESIWDLALAEFALWAFRPLWPFVPPPASVAIPAISSWLPLPSFSNKTAFLVRSLDQTSNQFCWAILFQTSSSSWEVLQNSLCDFVDPFSLILPSAASPRAQSHCSRPNPHRPTHCWFEALGHLHKLPSTPLLRAWTVRLLWYVPACNPNDLRGPWLPSQSLAPYKELFHRSAGETFPLWSC